MEDNKTSALRLRNPPFWDHQRHVRVALRSAIIELFAKRLEHGADKKLADLGCGSAPYRQDISALGYRYYACDIAPGSEIEIKPGEAIPLDSESMDVVVSFQVLEHVWDLKWYLGEAHRILKKSGFLVLSTHGTWPYHPHPTDYRRWTKDGLLREVEQYGFIAEECTAIVGPLAWTTQIRLLGYWHVLKRLYVIGPIVLFFLCLFMNLRMMIEDFITPKNIKDENACVYLILFKVVK